MAILSISFQLLSGRTVLEMAFFQFLLSVFVLFFSDSLTFAQDPPGFINLDCGLMPENASYVDRNTTLKYISDARFTSYGEIRSIKNEYRDRVPRPFWFLRSFPEGERNCYELNLTKGGHYLIRVSSFYGNYDDLNRKPVFEFDLGTNFWKPIRSRNWRRPDYDTLWHVLQSDRLQICFVKTEASMPPYVSALEVRPVKSGTYVTQGESLQNGYLRYVGLADDPEIIRYPIDIQDRVWEKHFEDGWKRLTTANRINTTDDVFEIPQQVIRTAATPINSSEPLNISLHFLPNLVIYVYMHFVETVKLKPNESREFSITFNGNVWRERVHPRYLTLTTEFDTEPLKSSDGKCEFVFKKTENSTHAPIINAFQVLYATDMLDSGTDRADVDAINGIKSVYGVNIISWRGDPCAPEDHVWEGVNCSKREFENPRIISLNLSWRGLTGEITPYFSNLTRLTTLDLSNNALTGTLPEFLSQMTSLRILNLSGNNLQGPIPAALTRRKMEGSLMISVEGIRDLGSSHVNNNKKKTIILIVATVSTFSVVIVALAIFMIRRRMKHAFKASCAPPSSDVSNRRLSYADVITITNNFERVLGRGGFGVVYHGCMDGRQVAVKMLLESSTRTRKQFKAEVEILLRVHHRHLVSLMGYCEDGDKLALIYEFMANRDLKEHLSGKCGTTFLNWKARLQIAAEAAQGLQYLHCGCRPSIVHRDVKTTNILLDEHLRAKLADFGLSRSFPDGSETHISTVMAGTLGFLDPEYCRTNRLIETSDVYSFGVVLLEIITNRPVIDETRDQPHISDWVSFMLSEGDMKRIIDPKLHGDFDTNSAWKVIEVAMACVSQPSHRRPSMTQVMMELDECLAEAARNHMSYKVRLGYSRDIGPEGILSSSDLTPSAR